MPLPQIVSQEEWQAASDELLVKEKAATRALDALAAERRTLPMVRVDGDYAFTVPGGEQLRLADLFDGSAQLIVYHFMFPAGAKRPCGGCASFTDNVPNLAHLRARDTRMVLVAPAGQEQIQALKQRMGWTVPWYTTGRRFNDDLGIGDGFALSVFLRDGDDVFRTYMTRSRGVDRLRMDFNLLDLTPYGRQEHWEDSPEGWPQTPPYTWWRLNDEYEMAVG